jgi:hypothetical protein
MQSVSWSDVRDDLEWDGSWRDIYVLGTSRQDWQALLDFLRTSGYEITFCRAEGQAALPENVSHVFDLVKQIGRPLLQVEVGGVVLNCHFFTECEIEFDFDPREVQTDEEVKSLFAFMRRLSLALRKPVRMTPEGMCEVPLWEYFPDRDRFKRGKM